MQSLNDEAQARRLAVISRDRSSAYRVRGYLAAKVVRDNTTISWVWDVFDGNERRALRITGEEVAKGHHSDAWSAADDAMLKRIARASMDQLAAFVTSAEVTPGTAQVEPAAFLPDASSPEAAGIFRIPRPQADPVSGKSPAGTAPEAAAPAPAEAVRETPTRLASNG